MGGVVAKAGAAEGIEAFRQAEAKIRAGGGSKAIERQHEKNRLTARERIAKLVDPTPAPARSPERERRADHPAGAGTTFDPHRDEIPNFQELGLWAAFGMYAEHGGAPAAGVVTGIGVIHGRRHMIIANDATVKAGAFFPMTCKKIIRAQHIARMARMPLVYLVDSAGVYLPLQEDVFPDTDDFGRIFYLNSVISAEGIPQTAAIMGFCVAGGGYLPVLCDTLLMTEGSGLYLAGQALVKAAIGQEVTDEELGGAQMHAQISGTIDFREPDDDACLVRLRELLGKRKLAQWHSGTAAKNPEAIEAPLSGHPTPPLSHSATPPLPRPVRSAAEIPHIFKEKPGEQYDIKDILACILDARAFPVARLAGPGAGEHGSASRATAERVVDETLQPDFDEYKAEYGRSIVCGYARLGGHACGIVANQGRLTEQAEAGGKAGPHKSVNMPRVIYDESADKAARFIMDCNQRKIPIIFLHDTTGFMVGRDSEQGGIIRAGAKMVNAMSNCVVPKIVVILGSSYGAGNYAMCGRAFEPFLSLAWPGAKCAVMGAAQATGVLAMIEERSRERKGEQIDKETHETILAAVRASYNEQQDIRHGAARGWLDRLIEPERTREELIAALEAARQGWDYAREFRTGVLQV
jgi:acetyl-CoA carboxylase carboxyltransferase component